MDIDVSSIMQAGGLFFWAAYLARRFSSNVLFMRELWRTAWGPSRIFAGITGGAGGWELVVSRES